MTKNTANLQTENYGLAVNEYMNFMVSENPICPVIVRWINRLPSFLLTSPQLDFALPNHQIVTALESGEHTAGHPQLRQGLSAYYNRRYTTLFNQPLSAENVMVTENATSALAQSILVFTSIALSNADGQAVFAAVPQFRWHGIDRLINSISDSRWVKSRLRIIEIPQLPDGSLDPGFIKEKLSRRTDVAFLYTASPGAPDGAVASAESTKKLADFLRKKHIPFIEDVANERLTGVSPHPVPLLSQYNDEGVVVGKSGYTWNLKGCNAGWIISQPVVIRSLEEIAHDAGKMPPTLEAQRRLLSVLALPESYYDGLREYQLKLNGRFIQLLPSTLPPIRSAQGPSVTVDIAQFIGKKSLSGIVKTIDDGIDFCHDMALASGVFATPVTAFARNYVRFGLRSNVNLNEVGGRIQTYCKTVLSDHSQTRGVGSANSDFSYAFYKIPGSDEMPKGNFIFPDLHLKRRNRTERIF